MLLMGWTSFTNVLTSSVEKLLEQGTARKGMATFWRHRLAEPTSINSARRPIWWSGGVCLIPAMKAVSSLTVQTAKGRRPQDVGLVIVVSFFFFATGGGCSRLTASTIAAVGVFNEDHFATTPLQTVQGLEAKVLTAFFQRYPLTQREPCVL